MFQPTTQPRPAARLKEHVIEDISYRCPMFILCSCGYRTEAPTSRDLETLWKYHRKDVIEGAA